MDIGTGLSGSCSQHTKSERARHVRAPTWLADYSSIHLTGVRVGRPLHQFICKNKKEPCTMVKTFMLQFLE